MNNFITYILQVSASVAILYLFYYIILRKQRFLQVNRVYLLVFIPIAFSLPLLKLFQLSVPAFPTTLIPSNGFDTLHQHASIHPKSTEIQTTSWQWLPTTYLVGTCLYLLWILRSLVRTTRLLLHAPREIYGRVHIIHTKVEAPLAFFHWVVLPLNISPTENPEITEHELAHCRLGHSYDLLFIEFTAALMWFNPFIYFYRKELRKVHEYQADQAVLTHCSNIQYLEQLRLQFTLTPTFSMNSYFNYSMLRQRIDRISHPERAGKNRLRYFLILPVLAALTLAFSNAPETELNIPSISPIDAQYNPRISSGYGMRKHPIHGKTLFHYAVDIIAPMGTPIIATADGVVTKVEFKEEGKGYGRRVLIQHNETYATHYTQLSAFNVKEGQQVKKGDVVGLLGQSGISTGPHLHYEVYKNGERVDPEAYWGE